ncbi:MAG: hypothetical protein SGI84_11410 [Gemmatimonadota bacterium]|nr:hypothetical protein [Gemmatimonadota bacterium]
MSLEFYKVLHVAAVIGVFISLGAVCFHAMNGGSRGTASGRGLVAALHGGGLFLALVGGFGLLARNGLMGGWPGWVWAKLALWIILGALVAVPYRRPALARPILLVLPVVGLTAAWLAILKPF